MEYKLAQWYPSLPTEWNVDYRLKNKSEFPIIVVEREDGYNLHPSLKNLTRSLSKGLSKEEVEKNSEFWEKVTPKEFKILEVGILKDTSIKFTKGHTPLLNKGLGILSVKRLSDGEVFSVGDRVEYRKKKTKIEKIYYNEHNQLSFKVEGTSAPLTGCFSNNMPHFKKLGDVVLTTEDGVDLVAGDRYFVPQVERKHRRLTGESIMFYVEPDMPEDNTKRFAKEENAQVYIENNIELFSAKDIHELLKKYSRMMVDSSVYLELSKMVKGRLNGDN